MNEKNGGGGRGNFGAQIFLGCENDGSVYLKFEILLDRGSFLSSIVGGIFFSRAFQFSVTHIVCFCTLPFMGKLFCKSVTLKRKKR